MAVSQQIWNNKSIKKTSLNIKDNNKKNNTYMKKYIYPMLLTSAIFTAACSSDDSLGNENIPNGQKEQISFSLSDNAGSTRAGFTVAATRIVARMQSDEKDGTGVRYTKSVLTAQKDATNNATSYSTVGYSSTGETRYWDDAFGRKGQLSVYAVAIPNSTETTNLAESLITGGATWATEASPNNTIDWSVSTDQSHNPLAAEDLAYSNNIQDGGKDGRYTWDYTNNKYTPDATGATTHADGRMIFTQKEGAQDSDAGHFDKGHLVFNHSLSRLTVVLEEGKGFDGNKATDADFKFTNSGDNICLKNMITSGTLDIKAGTWGSTTPADITKMAPTGNHYGANGTYASQMLPGYKFYKDDGTESVKNVMQFVIDNNTYYVTQAQVFAALNTEDNTTGTTPKVTVKQDGAKDYIEMEQGKNYVITVTVKKTGIEAITATLAEWVEVTGSTSVNNAHLEFTMTASGSACTKDIDLYRLDDVNAGYDANNYTFTYEGKNWFGNYTTDAEHKITLKQSDLADGKWSTTWFFESNKTYYHFRTVNKGTTIEGNTGDGADSKSDYFTITGGATASTDPHWGAPMTGSGTAGYLKYDTDKGFEAFLRPAIGATESTIAIQEIHMMSNIEVILKTPDDGGKVKLADGDNNKTVVKITRLATTGTVEMGRGVVTPATTYDGVHTMTAPTTYWKTSDTETNPYTFTVVPQALSRNFSSADDTDYIGIFIQTPDNNQYYVVKKLSEVIAESVSDERNQAQNEKIQRWFPGHKYTYTITISKKGIEAITATVADWVTVTGNVGDITLED